MNGDMHYFQVRVDIFDNRKIKQIIALPDGYLYFAIWIKMLSIAMVTNDEGKLLATENIPYTNEMIALEFNCSVEKVNAATEVFKRYGMVLQSKKGMYSIKNWSKYQSIDALAKRREKDRARQQKHRAKTSGHEDCHVTVTLPSRDVTPAEGERNLQSENDKLLSLSGECSDTHAENVKKSRYGKYNNVSLSAKEYKSLKEMFTDNWQDRIDNLSGYLYMHPEKHYPSHYRVIRVWEQQDAQKGRTGATSGAQHKSAFHDFEQRNYTDQEFADIELAMRNRH